LRNRIRGSFTFGVVDDDARALRSKATGARSADSRRRSGDDTNGAGQLHA